MKIPNNKIPVTNNRLISNHKIQKKHSFLNLRCWRIFNNWKSKTENLQNGFTLIELLLYLGIFSILLIVLFQLFASIIDVQSETQVTSSVTEDARFILNRLVYDLRRADTILIPASPGVSGSTLEIQTGNITYTYSLNGQTLMLADSSTGMSDQVNSINTNVTGLSFTKIGNATGKPTIEVSVTLASKTVIKGVPNTETFHTTIGTR